MEGNDDEVVGDQVQGGNEGVQGKAGHCSLETETETASADTASRRCWSEDRAVNSDWLSMAAIQLWSLQV